MPPEYSQQKIVNPNSHVCQRRRAAGRNQQVEKYKHTHKIVKMNLINSRREKSPQLSDESKHKFQINFHQIKSKMATNNMSIIHVSPNLLSTLRISRCSFNFNAIVAGKPT